MENNDMKIPSFDRIPQIHPVPESGQVPYFEDMPTVAPAAAEKPSVPPTVEKTPEPAPVQETVQSTEPEYIQFNVISEEEAKKEEIIEERKAAQEAEDEEPVKKAFEMPKLKTPSFKDFDISFLATKLDKKTLLLIASAAIMLICLIFAANSPGGDYHDLKGKVKNTYSYTTSSKLKIDEKWFKEYKYKDENGITHKSSLGLYVCESKYTDGTQYSEIKIAAYQDGEYTILKNMPFTNEDAEIMTSTADSLKQALKDYKKAVKAILFESCFENPEAAYEEFGTNAEEINSLRNAIN